MAEPAIGGAVGKSAALVGKFLIGKGRTWRFRLAWRIRKAASFPVPFSKLRATLKRYERPDQLDLALATPGQVTTNLKQLFEDHRKWKSIPGQELANRYETIERLLSDLLQETVSGEQVARIAGERGQRETRASTQTLTTILDRRVAPQLDPDLAEHLPPYLFSKVSRLVQRTPQATAFLDALLQPDPRPTLKAWLHKPPPWLQNGGPEAWTTFGEALSAYGFVAESAKALERAVEEGAVPIMYWRARAALAAGDDTEIALSLLSAEAATSDDHMVRGVLLIINGDVRAALAEFETWQPADQYDAELRTLLIARALANIERHDDAIQLLSDKVGTTKFAGIPLLLAELYIHRTRIRRSLNRDSDLHRAVEAALLARDRRRNWRGDSVEAIKLAADALVLAGDMDAAWTIMREEPEGTAMAAESSDDRLRPPLAMAAAATGRRRLAEQIASELDAFEQAWLHAITLEYDQPPPGAPEDELSAWRDVSVAAWRALGRTAETPDQILIAAHSAAASGVHLEELETLGEQFRDESAQIRQLAAAAHDPALLRNIQSTSKSAAVRLSEILIRDGDYRGAATVLMRAAERFGDETLRLTAASQLAAAGDYQAAADQANRLATAASAESNLRARALMLLVDMWQRLGDWGAMAAAARQLLDLPQASDDARWALAVALTNQSQYEEAWNTLRTGRGTPHATTRTRAGLLIKLQARYASVHELITSGLSILREFPDDEQLSAMVIGIMLTKHSDSAEGESVTSDEADQIRSAVEAFFDKYPESVHLRQYDASDVATLMAQVTELIEPHVTATADLVQQVVEGRLPLGMLASAAHKTYLEAIVRRAGEGIKMQSADIAEQELERQLLRTTIGNDVIVDATALHTMVLLDDAVAAQCIGSHSSVVVLDPVLSDIVSARDVLALRSTGSFVYDARRGHAVLDEVPRAIADERAERSAAVATLALQQVREPWPELNHLNELQDVAFLPWAAPLDAAIARRAPLWSDDLTLRRFARAMGVEAFGTTALLDVLAEDGHLSVQQRLTALDDLAWNYAVDLQFEPTRWERVAMRDSWEPKAAAFLLSRPASWTNPQGTLTLVEGALAQSLGEEAWVIQWTASAAVGIGRATPADQQASGLAQLLLYLWTRPALGAEALPEVLQGARLAADVLHLDDPLPKATLLLHKVVCANVGEASAISVVLRLAIRAEQRDRELMVETILRRPPDAES